MQAGTNSLRQLIDIVSLSREQIIQILNGAHSYKENKKNFKKMSRALLDKFVGLMFFEPSTRTQLSFETAAKILGASTVQFRSENSALLKGEDDLDTVLNFASIVRPQILIIRHGSDSFLHTVANIIDVPVVNAGGGQDAHPTQALTDAFTLFDALIRPPS